MKRLDISFSLLSAFLITQATVAYSSDSDTRVLDIPFEESPYPAILNRMPFGAPPSPVTLDPTAVTMDQAKLQAEQKKLADSFSWTAINITPEGKTAIGFTDLSAKPPESYYITVGESANSWKLIRADYNSETATIEKDGIQISLKFGNKSPVAPVATELAPSGALTVSPSLGSSRLSHLRRQPSTQPHMSPMNANPATPSIPGGTLSVPSYRERLAERVKVQENLKQESDRKQKEELSKIVTDALRKQQEEAAAAAALQEPVVVPEGQPIEVIAQ